MDLQALVEGLFGASGRPAPPPPGTKREKPGDQYDDGAGLATLEELLRPSLGATTVPKERQGAQRQENLEELLGIVPVVGNALSARDAQEGYNTTLDEWESNSNARNALNVGSTGLSALGAVLGLPFSKTAGKVAKEAKNTANVFVPAISDAATDTAVDMRLSGKSNEDVWKETKRFFGPEGKVRQSISDKPIRTIDPQSIVPGDMRKLGEVIEHPELFDQFPHLKEKTVRFHGGGDRFMQPSRTNAAGEFEVPTNPHGVDIAKLLQYDLAETYGFSPAARHSADKHRAALASALERTESAMKKTGTMAEYEALSDYAKRLRSEQNILEAFLGQKHKHSLTKASQRVGGNADARRVQALQSNPALGADTYPYGEDWSGNRAKAYQRPLSFPNLYPLPPNSVKTPEQLREFATDWKTKGSGVETFPLDDILKQILQGR